MHTTCETSIRVAARHSAKQFAENSAENSKVRIGQAGFTAPHFSRGGHTSLFITGSVQISAHCLFCVCVQERGNTLDLEHQKKAPIYEALEKFRRQRVVPFDVPGHKRGRGNPELVELLGEKCVSLDVNSMKPLDNLCHPVSVIKDAEDLAADAFGAAQAFLMVGGTTSSVQSMILTACKPGDKIILPRNVHKSAINALVLCGAKPVYIDPKVDRELGIPLGMEAADVRVAIEANPDAVAVFINNIWNEFCTSVAQSRHIEASTIKQFADSLGMLSDPKLALSNKLIDQLCYEHEFESIVKENLKLKEDKEIPYVLPVELNNSPEYTPNVSSNKIALLVAEGDIVVEGPETSIASATLVPEIIKLANDDEVKGLVLRVNSPGGSAYASEQIWEALEFFKGKGKTLAVSMGDYAASGGYYISCGANRIFAEPNTITGSIGIFGMIPSIKGFVSGKLGVTSDVVSTTPNADLSLMEPMTPFQREAMQNNVNRGYELFTSRCAKGRNIPLDTLKSIAEGRVWDGKEALRLKLVDEFGGIDDAIQWVAKEEKIQNDYSVSLYPVFEEDLLNMIFKSVPVNAAAAQQPAQELYLQETVDRIQNILKQDKLQCRMDDIYIY